MVGQHTQNNQGKWPRGDQPLVPITQDDGAIRCTHVTPRPKKHV